MQVFHEKIGYDFHAYSELHAQLAKCAKTYCEPPEWAAEASAQVLWPGVFVGCCEYSQCVEDFGYARVRAAASAAKKSRVAVGTAVAEYVKSRGEGGKCLTAYLIEKVLAASPWINASASERGKGKTQQQTHVDEHMETMVKLASHGLIPKLFWWTTPDALSILEGAREGVEAAGKTGEAALNFAIGIHGQFTTPSAGSSTSAASADPPPICTPCQLGGGTKPSSSKSPLWPRGANKVACEVCGAFIRLSGMARHLKDSCPGAKAGRAARVSRGCKRGRGASKRGKPTRTKTIIILIIIFVLVLILVIALALVTIAEQEEEEGEEVERG